jgi:hypothetical protein
MVYEWRVYEILPGKMPDIHKRFAEVTLSFFKKHGMEVVGFWEAVIGSSNTLYYMLKYNDLAHREKAWAAFIADPERQSAFAESEKDGPIIARVHNTILKLTPYSKPV